MSYMENMAAYRKVNAERIAKAKAEYEKTIGKPGGWKERSNAVPCGIRRLGIDLNSQSEEAETEEEMETEQVA